MHVLLAFAVWKVFLAYLHGIVAFSDAPQDHIAHVRCILWQLYDEGGALKLKKYKFFSMVIDYLGHVIRPGYL